MQSCPGLCKTVRWSWCTWCTWLYMYVILCARVSERACTEPTYMQHEYSRIVWLQRPNISHVNHDMHLACKKNGKSVPSIKVVEFTARTSFLHGGDITAYANVSWRTQLHDAAAARRTRLHNAKPSGEHYCICNNVLRILLHGGHNCMRHRRTIPGVFNISRTFLGAHVRLPWIYIVTPLVFTVG